MASASGRILKAGYWKVGGVPADVFVGPRRVRVGVSDQSRLVSIFQKGQSKLSISESETGRYYNLDRSSGISANVASNTFRQKSEADTENIRGVLADRMTWRSEIDPVAETRAYAETILRTFAAAKGRDQKVYGAANAKRAIDQMLFFLNGIPEQQISKAVELLLGLGAIENENAKEWTELRETEQLEALLVSHGRDKQTAKSEALRLIS